MPEGTTGQSVADVRCPDCRAFIFHRYVSRGEVGLAPWYHCSCGLLFNLEKTDLKEVFNEAYRRNLEDRKEAKERYGWYVATYATLMEERTDGRRMLDVGCGTRHVQVAMEGRGWVVDSVDLIDGCDFESAKLQERYDLLWLADVLQCFKDPARALRTCYKLLRPTGLLFLVTPDADLLRMGRFADFGHWDARENRRFVTRDILERMLVRAPDDHGRFDVLLQLHNHSQRYPTWNNLHLLAQKQAYGV